MGVGVAPTPNPLPFWQMHTMRLEGYELDG
jgi:hypothetical protein